MELDPEEFLAEVKAGGIYPPEKLNNFFDGRSDAPKSLNVYAAAVKKLLQVNLSREDKKKIDWDDLELPKMRTVETDRAPTREVFKRALAESRGIRDRVVPLIALSSGMRIGSIARLTVGEVDLEEFPDVAVIRVAPDIAKGKVGYVTFLTKEAKSALTEYLEQRRRSGEEINDGSPLVATPAGGFYSAPRKLSTRWSNMLDRAGLGQKGRKHRIYHFHSLRKFFRTALERAGVSKSFRERLLGHSGEYLDASYFDPAFEELLASYRTAAMELTVHSPEIIGEERMATLEGELAETRKAFEALKDATVGRMMRELEAKGVDTSKSPHELAVEMGIAEARPEQKVIDEEGLVAHLSDGWRFVAQLNNGSGKIVVEK